MLYLQSENKTKNTFHNNLTSIFKSENQINVKSIKYTLEKRLLQMLWSCGKCKCTRRLRYHNFSSATNFYCWSTNNRLRTSEEYISVTIKQTSNDKDVDRDIKHNVMM